MARRGAGRLGDGGSSASDAWRQAVDESGEQERRPAAAAPRPGMAGSIPEDWVLVDDLADEAEAAVRRGRTAASRTPASIELDIEGDVRAELVRAVGATKADKYEQRLKDATRAFEAERYGDAARILRRLADEAPGAPSVRELYGLTLYRQGKWRLAAHELEAFRQLTDSTEQHPVLADCYRALRQHRMVAELWQELKDVLPSAELVTEGRIVAAGSLADQGDVAGAIALLQQGFTFPKRPKEHHLRRAYALADCYERAGDVVRARELFERVAAADPGFADVRGRVRSLR